MAEVIDLCSDDDDEDDTLIDPPKPQKRQKLFTIDVSSDSDDDSLLEYPCGLAASLPPKTITKSPSALKTPYAVNSKSGKEERRFSTSKSPGIVNPYATVTPGVAASLPENSKTTAPTKAAAITTSPHASTNERRISTQKTSPITFGEPLDYPRLSDGGKEYPDLRASMILSLWKCAKSMVHQSYQRPKVEQLVKRIVQLSLSENPVRSLHEYTSLQEDLKKGDRSWKTPVTGPQKCRQYYTVVEACLDALLTHAEANEGSSNRIDLYMSLQDLILAVDARLLPNVPGKLRRKEVDHGAAHYLESSTRSLEFAQISKLKAQRLIKAHKRGGRVLYELLDFDTARRIQQRQFPLPPGPFRVGKITRTVDPKYKGVMLGVDLREGGGGSKSLHKFCDKLDLMKIPFFVAPLSIGDYCFFTTDHLLCPILVERKSIQDLAGSIHDGRWQRQKKRMYAGQYIFGYENSRMVYVIEGNQQKETVSGGYIGARHFQVDQDKLQSEIDMLEEEGFDVMKTPSAENTMFELARWASRVAKEMANGTLKATMTYPEFMQRVRQLNPNTDFSRMAKYHRQERVSREAEAIKPDDTDVILLGDDDERESKSTEKATKTTTNTDVKHEINRRMYLEMSKAQLQQACADVGLPRTAKDKEVLIERLLGPHPPPAWLKRKRSKQYV